MHHQLPKAFGECPDNRLKAKRKPLSLNLSSSAVFSMLSSPAPQILCFYELEFIQQSAGAGVLEFELAEEPFLILDRCILSPHQSILSMPKSPDSGSGHSELLTDFSLREPSAFQFLYLAEFLYYSRCLGRDKRFWLTWQNLIQYAESRRLEHTENCPAAGRCYRARTNAGCRHSHAVRSSR